MAFALDIFILLRRMTSETHISAATALRFYYHCWRRDISNFSLLEHRDYTGFLITMHQGGTHWLKHMLAMALTRKYGQRPPRFSHANDVIAGVKDPRNSEAIPWLVNSHSIPHLLVASRAWRRVMKFPPYVVLVRDIRHTLVANYEKWRDHYGCSFSEFVRGDVAGHRFNTDLWWCLRFCNAWGTIAHRFPEETLVVKYEALQRDAVQELERVNTFLKLDLDLAALEYAVSGSTKEAMVGKADPDTPLGLTVVRDDPRPPVEWFDAPDRAYLSMVCRRFLKYDFGYDYGNWEPESSSS